MDFKRVFVLFSVLLGSFFTAHAQKPKVMVEPSTRWLVQNGYSKTIITDEGEEDSYLYKKALDHDPNLGSVITKIGQIMIERGFPLVDLNNKLTSGRGGSKNFGKSRKRKKSNSEKEQTEADITIQVFFKDELPNRPISKIKCDLVAIDPYTQKQVAACTGTGQQSLSSNISELLEEAIIDKMDVFANQLNNYFTDIRENGREVSFEIAIGADWDKDFNSEFKGKRLSSIVQNWVTQNSVKKKGYPTSQDEYEIKFEQVRIPLKAENGSTLTAQNFIEKLADFLKKEYGIISTPDSYGVGSASLFLGIK